MSRAKAVVILSALGALVAPSSAKTALLLVDVQDCFLDSSCTSTGMEGSLSVPACDILPKIDAIQNEKGCLFDEVIRTQDFHPENHISFGSTHGLAPFSHLGGKGGLPLMCILAESGLTQDGACCPTYYLNKMDPTTFPLNCDSQLCPSDGWDYGTDNPDIITNNPACSVCLNQPDKCFETEQAMWTDHCLQDGDSTFPSELYPSETDIIVQKGSNMYVDAYSAFMDNTQTLKTNLDSILYEKDIDTLFIAGIATDVCVQWTVTDALGDMTSNYNVYVIKDATAPVLGDMDNFNEAMGTMAKAGAKIIDAEDVLGMPCPISKCKEVKAMYKEQGCCGNKEGDFHF